MNVGLSNGVLDSNLLTIGGGDDGAMLARATPGILQSALKSSPTSKPAAVAASERNRSWASTIDGRTVGTVAIDRAAQDVVKLVFFRIDPEWQHTAVLRRLIRQVYDYCWQQGCMKLVVERGAMPGWMLPTMRRFGFLLSRRAPSQGKERWEFDLGPDRDCVTACALDHRVDDDRRRQARPQNSRR